METNPILDRNNYFNALELEDGLKLALKQLDKLMPRIGELSKADARFSGLDKLCCAGAIALAEARRTLQDTTNADKGQAERRGMKELKKLCHERLYQIPHDITWKHREHKAAKIDHAAACNDLQVRGYTSEQIGRIMEATPKPSDGAYSDEVELLEREQAALSAFAEDFPRFNQGLLIGTQFENWQPEKVVDFDAAAGALAV